MSAQTQLERKLLMALFVVIGLLLMQAVATAILMQRNVNLEQDIRLLQHNQLKIPYNPASPHFEYDI